MENTSFSALGWWMAIALVAIVVLLFLLSLVILSYRQARILTKTAAHPKDIAFFSNVMYLIVHAIEGEKLLVQRAYRGESAVVYDGRRKRYFIPSIWQVPLKKYESHVTKVFGLNYKYWMHAVTVEGEIKPGSVLKIYPQPITVCDPTNDCVWSKLLPSL